MPLAEVGVVTVSTVPAVAVINESAGPPGRRADRRSTRPRGRHRALPQLHRRWRGEGWPECCSASIRPYQAQLASAKAQLERAEANAVSARQKAERYKPLVAANAVSKQEFDEAVAAAGQANADIAAAKAAVTTAQINLGYTTVTAPITGRVGRALVTEGALVGKGEATKLTVVEQVDPIWVTFTQPAAEVARLRRAIETGQVEGGERRCTRAPVPRGGRPRVRPDRQAAVHGHDRGPDHRLDHAARGVPQRQARTALGTFVRVKIEQGVDENALTVPQRALIRTAQGASVMVVGADGKVAVVPVKAPQAIDDRWIITEGLKGGEKVIVEGLQKVQPGAPAKAVPFQAPKTASTPATQGRTRAIAP